MNGSIQGPGASAASGVSYSQRVLAAMNGEKVPPAPQPSSDRFGGPSTKRGQASVATGLVGNNGNGGGSAPPDLLADQQTGQLFTTDGQPYLGRALFIQGDDTVVDDKGQVVDLAALERAAGYNPNLVGQTGAATTGGSTQGAGQEAPDIFTNAQGMIVTGDGKPYLGRELYLQEDQTVVDRQGNIVNMAELEKAAGFAPPPAPPPPQYYRGNGDQLVDASGQPYLGVTMFVQGEQIVDANGQAVDLNDVIAAAGYDPNQDPAPEGASEPDPNAGQMAIYGTPQDPNGSQGAPQAPQGENKTVGIVRNLLAAAGDYRRWRQSTQPTPAPGDDPAPASTKSTRKPRSAGKVPPLPKNKPATGKTGKTQSGKTTGKQPTTQTKTKTTSTKVNPDSPIPGTRDMRITRAARQDFLGRKREIMQGYKAEARLPREAQKLTETQRTRMRQDVREHQVAAKQFKEAYVKVQKWNKQDPGKLTTTQHRELVRDQQTLELAQKQVQKAETKVNEWYKKIGKKPIDTVVTIQSSKKTTSATKPVTPKPGTHQVTVTPATRKAFQAEWKTFTAENEPILPATKLSTGVNNKLTTTQRKSLLADLRQNKLSQDHLDWKKSEVAALQKIKPSKLTPVQKRTLSRHQQMLKLSEQNLQKTGAKLNEWENKLGRKLTIKTAKGTTEVVLGPKISKTAATTKPAPKTTTVKPAPKTTTGKTGTVKPAPRTSTKGSVKPGARTQSTKGGAVEPQTGLKSLSGKVLPGLMALNDAYSMYQGVSHWNDEGNTKHFDDAMRVGGAALSGYASVQQFRKGNFTQGIGLHATGLALNLIGQMTNDQD